MSHNRLTFWTNLLTNDGLLQPIIAFQTLLYPSTDHLWWPTVGLCHESSQGIETSRKPLSIRAPILSIIGIVISVVFHHSRISTSRVSLCHASYFQYRKITAANLNNIEVPSEISNF